jgi:nucleotidyltransferase/DNA polymerase involved in DNA repair
MTPRSYSHWHGRAILHVDMDAFFAAVEQLDHPEWRGRPVIVGGSPEHRGVVSAASYEARPFGVRSAMPSARALRLCPDAVWAKPRFERYQELSSQVRAIFEDETPLVQPVSIDEAFLDVSPGQDAAEQPEAIALRIQSRIDSIGLSCSIGLATSKTVAKIASDADKPHGLVVVRPGEEAEFLAPMPVGVMSGIGPRTQRRLAELGIHALGDLAALDDGTSHDVLGSYGPTLVKRSRGIDTRPVRENEPAKSVSNERTFAEDVRARDEVESAIRALACRVGRRLRCKGVMGRTVTVKVRFSDFTTRTVQRTLETPTDSETLFGPVAIALVHEVWSPGIGLRLLGVGVSGFSDRAEQMGLFEEAADGSAVDRRSGVPEDFHASRPQERLLRGIDAVRERFGDDAVRTGREMQARPAAAPSFAPSERDEDDQ